MLSKAAKNAIRATMYLALYSDKEHKISAKKIAEDLRTPLPFLAKQLQQLSRARLISSTKGPHGGFFLSDANKKRNLWDVIVCIDGEEKFNECFLGKEECNHKNPCSVHHIVVSFKNKLMNEYREKTIDQLVDLSKRGKTSPDRV
jgi:Rrf2 family protein